MNYILITKDDPEIPEEIPCYNKEEVKRCLKIYPIKRILKLTEHVKFEEVSLLDFQ